MMGKPFVGRGLLGYDNTKQTFNYIWTSDMQTSMLVSQGKGTNDNKVITLEGKADCPATGQQDMPMKMVYRLLGPDKHVFEMYDGSKGENMKSMEITYTKKRWDVDLSRPFLVGRERAAAFALLRIPSPTFFLPSALSAPSVGNLFRVPSLPFCNMKSAICI